MSRAVVRAMAALSVAALFAAACGDDGGGDAAAEPGEDTAAGPTEDADAESTEDTDAESTEDSATASDDSEGAGLLPDRGECDASLTPYKVGNLAVWESPILSMRDLVDAVEVSAEAFNARGGVGGHCIEVIACDGQADPNAEVDCARQLVDEEIVATVNDSTVANGPGVLEVLEAARIPRVGVAVAAAVELESTLGYPIGAGSSGAVIMTVPTCARAGFTNLAAIHVDVPTIQGLFAAMDPMVEAYGAEWVAQIPVPAGTTDFQQFVLRAEQAGADCIIISLGEHEAQQVLQAAQQLGSEVTYAASLGTFAQADMEAYGDFAGQLIFNSEIPPVTGSVEEWPILETVATDLEASGEDELQRDQVKSSPFRSWIAVYHLVTVVEQFGDPDDVSPEAVMAAFEAAEDVDTHGLIPPWTPSDRLMPDTPFGAISQPWYHQFTFDPEQNDFVTLPENLHLINEISGNTEYEQPS